MSKPKTVKQSMKTASWFMAIAKDDEEALQAFELLRKRGCFNTRLWKWNTRDEMQLIRRWYIYPKEPALEIQRRRLYGQMDEGEQKLAEHLDYHARMRAKWIKDTLKMENQIIRLENKIARLEAEKAELRKECMTEEGLHDYSDIVDILESGEYGSWIKVDENKIVPTYDKPNQNFVTADMSATLGRGTHVLIDIDKVPKDLQVLLAKMMDTLNNHTLRISNLENC